MATVGNLVVNMLGNTQHLQQSLTSAQGMLSSFQSRVKSIMGSAAATIAAGFGVTKAVQAAQGQIDAEKKLSAVLKATGGAARVTTKEIADLAGELQTVNGISDDATIGAAALLATFGNIKGETFKETLRVAQDLSTLMETDMKDAALFLGKALNDPEEAFARLKKSGVSLTEAQKQNIVSLQQSGNIGGAQNALNEAISGRVGGVAKAMNNPLKNLKNTIGDVLENIGFMILPTLEKIANGLNKVLGPLATDGNKYKAVGQAIAEGLSLAISAFMIALEVARDFVRIISEIPDTARAVAFTLAALTAVVITMTLAYKAAAMAKAFFLALSGPKGVAIIVGAIVATAALGLAMYEMHDRYLTANKDSEVAAKKADEETKSVVKLSDARKKLLQDHQAFLKKEHERVGGVFKEFTTSGSDKGRAEILKARADFQKYMDNIRLPADQQAEFLKIADPAIENKFTGIVDAIRDAQTEAKILRGELTAIDKTIMAFADKGASQARQDELRKILEANEQFQRNRDFEKSQQDRAKQILGDLRSPLEEAGEKFREIQALQSQGLLTQDEADRARNKVAEGLAGDTGGGIGAVGALEEGSAAAFSAIQAAIRSGQKDEVAKNQLDIAKKQLAELEQANDLRREQAQAPAGLEAIGI